MGYWISCGLAFISGGSIKEVWPWHKTAILVYLPEAAVVRWMIFRYYAWFIERGAHYTWRHVMTSQNTGNSTVCSTACSAYLGKYQRSALLTLCEGNTESGFPSQWASNTESACMSWHHYALLWHHDDVMKWTHFPRYWPFVRGIHRSPVNSTHKGQWRGALIFSLICVWINGWVNNREAGDLIRNRAHNDVIVMWSGRTWRPADTT